MGAPAMQFTSVRSAAGRADGMDTQRDPGTRSHTDEATPVRGDRYLRRMSGPRGKQLTPDQIAAGALDLSKRLRRHLDVLDAGEPSAAQDVAVALRTLVSFGQGDNVIGRLCKAYGISYPTVMLSRADRIPDRAGAHLWLGGLPTNAAQGIQWPGSTTTLDSDAWARSDALISQGSRPVSWQKLIGQLANTWGSHLSTETPHLVTDIELADVADISLGHYVTRQAGWVAEDLLRQVLPQVGCETGHLPPRTLDYNNLIISALVVHHHFPTTDVRVLATTSDPSVDRPILRLRVEGAELFVRMSGPSAIWPAP